MPPEHHRCNWTSPDTRYPLTTKRNTQHQNRLSLLAELHAAIGVDNQRSSTKVESYFRSRVHSAFATVFVFTMNITLLFLFCNTNAEEPTSHKGPNQTNQPMEPASNANKNHRHDSHHWSPPRTTSSEVAKTTDITIYNIVAQYLWFKRIKLSWCIFYY